ncbi:tRNA(His) guanylyltransferase Thg1 family protein [Chitinolyticbacter meiyuanensis]|uniref:tRNA(His) guanylyltransferase Thg1 family protein n=1 Tax=Chitinolyticbacter meiyuanensis TaxID=682798 RepID=UPI0011E5CE08|nr:tRNA(His) guanylyltransferase Thg1 family protein [Chitinolyticbacter meiyuanensis]
MRFDELDSRMRVYETTHDHYVMPGIYMVVRLDGRGFTRNTKDVWQFEAPFDERFRDLMLETTSHLMNCGFNVVYGYTESDEISLLLRQDEDTFNRKTRKLISILAGKASARFSLSLGQMACFDARMCELPNRNLVLDYFRWRHEDAHRNALNAHCYWLLRKQGEEPNVASGRISGISTADKNELLFQNGINFNNLPAWQKRGMGVYWETYQKPAVNPQTGEATLSGPRRRLTTNLTLPLGDAYADFVKGMIEAATAV